jgi:hypothetical protein
MRQTTLKLAWVNPAFMAEPSNRGDRRRAEREGRVSPTSADGGNARPKYKTIVITVLITALATSLITGVPQYLYGLFMNDLKTRIVNEINQTLAPISRDVGDLKTQVAVLKNSVETLEKLGTVGRLKTQATKLGIKDPQIVSVDLKPQATFTAVYTLNDQPGYFVRIDYDIEAIEKDTLTMAVHGAVYSGGVVYSQIGRLQAKIPLTHKTVTFNWTGETPDGKKFPFPPVRFAILQRDESNFMLSARTINFDGRRSSWVRKLTM